MRIEFHFLEKNEPACGAPKASHATKDVENVPRCKKCLKIVADKFGKREA